MTPFWRTAGIPGQTPAAYCAAVAADREIGEMVPLYLYRTKMSGPLFTLTVRGRAALTSARSQASSTIERFAP